MSWGRRRLSLRARREDAEEGARAHLVDATLIVYDGARHELFNETNREEVRADLIRWLDERFAVD